MKKIAITMLALLPAMAGWAQDTLRSPFMENYFANSVPDPEHWDLDQVSQRGDRCGIVTKELVTGAQPLKVYGVAACMVTPLDLFQGCDTVEWWPEFLAEFRDTLTDECYEYLGIYLRDADSLVPHREVMVHKKYDTPAFYVETGRSLNYCSPDFIYPIYEKYFDSAITVTDTFYVGVTQRSMQNPMGVQVYDHLNFSTLAYASQKLQEYHPAKYCWPQENNVHWEWPTRLSYDKLFYLLFPILTPDPDAPEEPGEPASVDERGLLDRYVGVQPNPATDEARVLSSFGMTRIEAFNGEGRCVLDRQVEGVEATLDVAPWPAGTYLLRVTTPVGTVTKKLLVR